MKNMRDPKRKPTHPGEVLREDALPTLRMTQGFEPPSRGCATN